MRVEFNWTANQKRAKCVELFNGIVDKVVAAYALPPKERGMMEELIGQSVSRKRWLRAEFHVASDAGMLEIYDDKLRDLYKKHLDEALANIADQVTFSNFISAFGYCQVTVTAIGIPGIAENSQTTLRFQTLPSENYEVEEDPEARAYYPEETGVRLDKLLSNLVVLHCAMEKYQPRKQEA